MWRTHRAFLAAQGRGSAGEEQHSGRGPGTASSLGAAFKGTGPGRVGPQGAGASQFSGKPSRCFLSEGERSCLGGVHAGDWRSCSTPQPTGQTVASHPALRGQQLGRVQGRVMPQEGEKPPALLQPPPSPPRHHAPQRAGQHPSLWLGHESDPGSREAAWGGVGPEANFGLLGTALSARLPEELVRAAAFQGGVPRGEWCLFHAGATAAKERCPGKASWGLGY